MACGTDHLCPVALALVAHILVVVWREDGDRPIAVHNPGNQGSVEVGAIHAGKDDQNGSCATGTRQFLRDVPGHAEWSCRAIDTEMTRTVVAALLCIAGLSAVAAQGPPPPAVPLAPTTADDSRRPGDSKFAIPAERRYGSHEAGAENGRIRRGKRRPGDALNATADSISVLGVYSPHL